MRRLILVRHAKSSWEIECSDIERPLSNKGISFANKVAIHTKAYHQFNFFIVSSPAVRTIETAKIFLSHWGLSFSNCFISPSLYTFDGFQLEEIVKSYPNYQKNVILFGHNDAITEFVNKFGDENIINVPTAGFVEIIFNSDEWKTIKKGITNAIIFPKDL